jgi:hypothetical protein
MWRMYRSGMNRETEILEPKQFPLPQKGWSGAPYYVRASLLGLGLADCAQLFPTA